LRSGAYTKLAAMTTTAIGAPSMRGTKFSPTPTSATATSPAAMRPRQRVTSTFSPTKPSRAGSRVSDATMVTATTVAAPMASPFTKLMPMMSMPRREMTTVVPAKVTARPAVSMASVVANSPPWPSCRFSRYRVTMNSA
jgi:hypothetical protein